LIFELDNVELYFKNNRNLNGIYLKAETGTVTAVLGRNGCGKSCLLDIAFGHLNPKYKLIRINNKPLLKPLYSTGFASYLPQNHFIPTGMRLKFIFKLFKIDWTNFINRFNSFSVYKNSRLKDLSGGERRLIETYMVLKKGK
jgi:ABC-type cobalamin/Fe3+-siderophores transport system ATPase subunit